MAEDEYEKNGIFDDTDSTGKYHYQGELLNKQRSGFGICQWQNKTYKGKWAYGKM